MQNPLGDTLCVAPASPSRKAGSVSDTAPDFRALRRYSNLSPRSLPLAASPCRRLKLKQRAANNWRPAKCWRVSSGTDKRATLGSAPEKHAQRPQLPNRLQSGSSRPSPGHNHARKRAIGQVLAEKPAERFSEEPIPSVAHGLLRRIGKPRSIFECKYGPE
jgi:hypothetical protein